MNRMLRILTPLLALLAVLTIHLSSEAADAQLKAECIQALEGGPIVVRLTLTYTGKKPIEVLNPDLAFVRDVSIFVSGPKTWEREPFRSSDGSSGGLVGGETWNEGRQATRTVYIHHSGSKIPAGSAPVKFTWHLYAKPGDQLALHALASPSATIDVDVRPASAENIAAVRAGMEAVLARKDHTWEEEVLIVNSIAHTRHKEFLPIALSLLSSRRGPWVHVELRPYIYEWSKASAEIRAELFKYLRDHGTKTDAIIFARWKEDNASLSDQELRMLFDSQDIWIKVLTYQTFGHKLAPGYRESLKREIKALQEAIPM